MTQTETLASLKDHYLSAVAAGDTNRAMDVAEQYRRLTDRLISEDLPQQPAASYRDHYRQRWEALRDMPDGDLVPVAGECSRPGCWWTVPGRTHLH